MRNLVYKLNLFTAIFLARAVLVVGIVAVVGQTAEARKFDFKTENLAAYFRGTYGVSKVGNSAFGGSSGTDTTTDAKVPANFSGEFGIILSGAKFNIRLGGEVLFPKTLTNTAGVTSSGSQVFTLESSMVGFIPMGNLEIIAIQRPESRLLFTLGGGYAFVSLDNKYVMTPGQTAYPSITDHTESGKGQGTCLQASVGYEVLFTDTVTAAFDLGYRSLTVAGFKSTKDTTTFTGHQAEGDSLKNADGSDRTIDLGGPFVGLSFRFYL